MATKLNPTPKNIRRVRDEAGLSQTAAGALVSVHRSRWADYEAGVFEMDPARWELFLVKCGKHADYPPAKHVSVPRKAPTKVVAP